MMIANNGINQGCNQVNTIWLKLMNSSKAGYF